MSYERLDLNLLRVFDVIYSERNLTRAASILCISQPAVSNAVQRLRETLKDPLFIREHRGVLPTPFADSLAPIIHDALQMVRSGLKSRDEFDPATSQRVFRVSMNDPAEALFLPRLTMEALKSAPHVSFQSSYVGRHDLANDMAMGTVDVAIEVALPTDERWQYAELLNDDYVCMVRQDHPLVKRQLTLEKYLSLDHIHVTARRRGLGHVDRALADCHAARNIKLRTRNCGLAVSIVSKTDLSMSLPRRIASDYNLKALPLPFDVPPLQWRLYWPNRAEYDLASIWLRNLLVSIARNCNGASLDG